MSENPHVDILKSSSSFVDYRDKHVTNICGAENSTLASWMNSTVDLNI